MWLCLEGLDVSQDDVVAIADNSQVPPDCRNNPRTTTRDESHEMHVRSHRR